VFAAARTYEDEKTWRPILQVSIDEGGWPGGNFGYLSAALDIFVQP